MEVTMSWSSVLKSLLAVCTITHSSVSSAERYGCVSKQCANGICIPYSKNCESSKGCFFKEQKFEDPSLLLIEERGCSTDVCTELAFSTTLGSGRKFRYKYQCCFSEKCNQNLTHGSPPSTSPNGLECPACYNNSGSVCEPVPLKCTGAETKCVKVSGKANDRDTDIEGAWI
ncbi:o-1-like isoform X2 [Sigmodon hispidus]